MNTVSICSLALAVLLVGLGCPVQKPVRDEGRAAANAVTDSLRFDPLDLPSDLEVVPEVYGVKRTAGESAPAGGDVRTEGAAATDSLAVTGGQVFKVQIFSSKLFGEARRAKRVAEEIFDRPVTMDYEVPYFKVRVGSFADRYDAEKYSQRVRAAGYSDSWVVAATVATQQASPLYDSGDGLPAVDDTTGVADTTGAEVEKD